jgi:hypothetical protein
MTKLTWKNMPPHAWRAAAPQGGFYVIHCSQLLSERCANRYTLDYCLTASTYFTVGPRMVRYLRTCQLMAVLHAASVVAFPVPVGQEVTWKPFAEDDLFPSLGYLVDQVTSQVGDKGYNLLVPLSEDPQRIVRCWLSRGSVTPTGNALSLVSLPRQAPQEEVPYIKPYRSATWLADQYRRQGLSWQQSWNQFITDTVLQPKYVSEPLNVTDFYVLFGK